MNTWDDLFAEYLRAPGIIDRAVKARRWRLHSSPPVPMILLYRHTNSGEGEIDRLPMVLVAREDAGRMARLLASGQKLYADCPSRTQSVVRSPPPMWSRNFAAARSRTSS